MQSKSEQQKRATGKWQIAACNRKVPTLARNRKLTNSNGRPRSDKQQRATKKLQTAACNRKVSSVTDHRFQTCPGCSSLCWDWSLNWASLTIGWWVTNIVFFLPIAAGSIAPPQTSIHFLLIQFPRHSMPDFWDWVSVDLKFPILPSMANSVNFHLQLPSPP